MKWCRLLNFVWLNRFIRHAWKHISDGSDFKNIILDIVKAFSHTQFALWVVHYNNNQAFSWRPTKRSSNDIQLNSYAVDDISCHTSLVMLKRIRLPHSQPTLFHLRRIKLRLIDWLYQAWPLQQLALVRMVKVVVVEELVDPAPHNLSTCTPASRQCMNPWWWEHAHCVRRPCLQLQLHDSPLCVCDLRLHAPCISTHRLIHCMLIV